jgi:hypothetical protein
MYGDSPSRGPSPWAIGFAVFAATMMIIVGIFQFFIGLGAVIEGDFYDLARAYAFDMSVNTWGWLHIVIGIIVALGGVFVLTGNVLARALGIALAVLASIVNFLYIPYYPVWSIMVIALSIGAIWGLVVMGHPGEETATFTSPEPYRPEVPQTAARPAPATGQMPSPGAVSGGADPEDVSRPG